MRWLAGVSVLLIAGCATAPPQPGLVAAAHPPATIDRPWLVPMPADEITLLDTRTLQALRDPGEIPALNANGRVKRPGVWIGIGLGAVAGAVAYDVGKDVTEDTADGILECLFEAVFGGDDC